MKEKNYKWHKIADDIKELSFSSNRLAQIAVAGKTICIAFQDDHLFACTHKCPHAGGMLAEGYLDALETLSVRCTVISLASGMGEISVVKAIFLRPTR